MGFGRTLRTVRSRIALSQAVSSSSSSHRGSSEEGDDDPESFTNQLVPHPLTVLSNAPPTETQAYQIKQAIAGAETLLSSIEFKQLCVRRRVGGIASSAGDRDHLNHWGRGGDAALAATALVLAKQHEACVAFIQAHTHALSALRRLPLELLREIFRCLLPHSAEPAQFDTPLILSSSSPSSVAGNTIQHWLIPSCVCKAWRSAALSLPELWSYVPTTRLSSSDSARYIEGLERYLTYSQNAPLHIRVYAPFREYHHQQSHPALEALMKHAERWESLQMDSAFATYKYLESRLTGRLDALKYLCVDIWRYNPGETLGVFRDAWRLEHVSIQGFLPKNFALPWSTLKVYKEKVQNVGPLDVVLTRCRELQRLEITRQVRSEVDWVFNGAGGGGAGGLLEMQKLRTLYLRSDNILLPDDNLLDVLVLPALEDMQIIGSPGELIPHLTSLISRSSYPLTTNMKLTHVPSHQCNLRRLAFRTQAMSPGDLTSLLLHTPFLEELDIYHPPNQDAENLVYNPLRGGADSCLAPNLRRLYIHSNGDWGDEATYKRIARSRCEASFLHLAAGCHYASDSPATSTLASTTIKPLESLRFVFENTALCLTQQAAFEGWFDPTPTDLTVRSLLALKNNILLHLPEVDQNLPTCDVIVPRTRFLDLTFSRRLDALFYELAERSEIVSDVRHIYRSEIHIVLRSLSKLPENHIPGDEKYRFRERAAAILESWAPLFEADIADHLRWVRVGKHSLIYVPSDDKMRRSPDAIEKMVYGLEDDVHTYDLFWHKYM